MATPVQDIQTVTFEGTSTVKLIDGVKVRPLVTHADYRGSLTEVYSDAWGITEEPIVFAENATVHPGRVKGWSQHRLQKDRLLHIAGSLLWVLYDDREDSPTRGMINEICMTDRNRMLVLIPKLVYHAVQNVGSGEASFINFPTMAYNHADPDRFRLPVDNDVIPYKFSTRIGW